MQIKTTMRLSPHINQNGHHQKNPQTINAGEDVEKKKSSYTVGGNVNLYNHYGKEYADLKKKNRTKSMTQNNGRKQRGTEEHLDEGERGE